MFIKNSVYLKELLIIIFNIYFVKGSGKMRNKYIQNTITNSKKLDNFEEIHSNKILEENFTFNKLNEKYQPKLIFLIVQISICFIILVCATILKSFGGSYFEFVKQWYNDKINDSLIVEKSMQEYQDVINERFSKNVKFLNQNIYDAPNIDLSINLFQPLDSGKITSKFGTRNDPITGKKSVHNGLDIGTEGGKPIYAVMSGTIKRAEKIGGYGNCIIIDHGNNIETLYAHCKVLEVSTGSSVKRGQKIALVGSSGKSTGDHLHIEININGESVNPEKFLNRAYV